MELQARVTIRGAKFFCGKLDDGKAIDSGKIFIDMDLKGETSFGTCTQELKTTDSKLIEQIKHNPFPFIADVKMIMETNGKMQSQIVTDIKPLQREPEVKTKAA